MSESGGLFDSVLSLFFPKTCVLCGAVVGFHDLWCGSCDSQRVSDPCPRCGKPPELCSCRASRRVFAPVAGCHLYQGNIPKAIVRLKQYPDRRVAAFFAGSIRETLRDYWSAYPVDCIVPVPMNPEKFKEKSYNHAALLAKQLADPLSAAVEGNVLLRADDTRPQHGLSRPERLSNARLSYSLGDPGPVSGKSLLLVDDVYTTGATAQTCARLLLGHARSVLIVTAAIAPAKDSQARQRLPG